jgi:hypothetical protein
VNLSRALFPVLLCGFFAAVVSAQNLPVEVPEDGGPPAEAPSLEKKVQLVLDYMEIQNVMARHVYYYNAKTLPQYDPKPPAPYETWDESLSYVK